MSAGSAVCQACSAIEKGMEWLTKEKGGLKHTPTQPKPTMEQLERWSFDGVAEATDGCQVEPDGRCEHGHKSWLLVFGLI